MVPGGLADQAAAGSSSNDKARGPLVVKGSEPVVEQPDYDRLAVQLFTSLPANDYVIMPSLHQW